jgi:hypothetical protein
MHGRGAPQRLPLEAATGTSTAQPGLAQPTAQAATRRQGGIGDMLGQDQPSQFGAPVRMLLAQGLGLQDDRGGGVRAGRRVVVDGRLRLAVVVAPQAEQVINGPPWQTEALRQGRGRQPPLVAAKHRLTDRQRNGAWHGRRLPERKNQPLAPIGHNLPRDSLVQNPVAKFRAKRYGR